MNDECRAARRQREPTKSFAKLRLIRQVFICAFNDSQEEGGGQLIHFLSVQRGPYLTSSSCWRHCASPDWLSLLPLLPVVPVPELMAVSEHRAIMLYPVTVAADSGRC